MMRQTSKEPRVLVNFRIPTSQQEKFKAKAKFQGISQSKVIIRLIDNYILERKIDPIEQLNLLKLEADKARIKKEEAARKEAELRKQVTTIENALQLDKEMQPGLTVAQTILNNLAKESTMAPWEREAKAILGGLEVLPDIRAWKFVSLCISKLHPEHTAELAKDPDFETNAEKDIMKVFEKVGEIVTVTRDKPLKERQDIINAALEKEYSSRTYKEEIRREVNRRLYQIDNINKTIEEKGVAKK